MPTHPKEIMPQRLALRTTSAPSLTSSSSSQNSFDDRLSTVFTPPSSCTGLPLAIDTDEDDSGDTTTIFEGRPRAQSCYPPGYLGNLDDVPGIGRVYSPGQCPQGYETFTLAQDSVPQNRGGRIVTTTVAEGETAAVCCPGWYSWPTPLPSGRKSAYCQSELKATTTGIVLDEDDPKATIEPGTVYADAIQIRWKAEDFPNKAHSDTGHKNGGGSGSLSKGGQIGVGVGVSFLGLFILLLLFCLLRRRKHNSMFAHGVGHGSPPEERDNKKAPHRRSMASVTPLFPIRGNSQHKRTSAVTDSDGYSLPNSYIGSGGVAMVGARDVDPRRLSQRLPAYEPSQPGTAASPAELSPDGPVCPVEMEARPISPSTVNRLIARKNFLTERMNSLKRIRRKPTPIIEDEEEEEEGVQNKQEEDIGEDGIVVNKRRESDADRRIFLEELGRANTEEREAREKRAWMTSR